MPLTGVLLRQPFLRRILARLAQWRVAEKVEEITPYLSATDHVLDIGCGNGTLCRTLRERGYQTTALDVGNFSFYDDLTPITYDGTTMPFHDSQFDVALLITMLHHAPSPEKVLSEARRVAKRLIIIEEVETGPVNRVITYFVDSLFNLEFFGHPHTNKSDAGWKAAFKHLNLALDGTRYSKSLFVLNRVTYVLRRSS